MGKPKRYKLAFLTFAGLLAPVNFIPPTLSAMLSGPRLLTVAIAALTEDGHNGKIYEVTGPQMLTFGDVAQEISNATGRPIQFIQIPKEDFVNSIADSGASKEIAWLLNYLFETVLDGRTPTWAMGLSVPWAGSRKSSPNTREKLQLRNCGG